MTTEEFLTSFFEYHEEHKYMLESNHRGKRVHEIVFEKSNLCIYFTDYTYLEVYITEEGRYDGTIEGQW